MIRLQQDILTGEWVSMNGDRQNRPITQNQAVCPFCPGPFSEVGESRFFLTKNKHKVERF
jgi:UDPglucose--hexose-1-phosphate uridylyltransferase